MGRYAANTEVGSERSRAEIERTLTRYGATSFMYGWDQAGALVGFKAKDRLIRFKLPLPSREAFRYSPARHVVRTRQAQDAAYELAVRQRWRARAKSCTSGTARPGTSPAPRTATASPRIRNDTHRATVATARTVPRRATRFRPSPTRSRSWTACCTSTTTTRCSAPGTATDLASSPRRTGTGPAMGAGAGRGSVRRCRCHRPRIRPPW